MNYSCKDCKFAGKSGCDVLRSKLSNLVICADFIDKRIKIIHYGELGVWKECVNWQHNSGSMSTIKNEVTCKRCKAKMGWQCV